MYHILRSNYFSFDFNCQCFDLIIQAKADSHNQLLSEKILKSVAVQTEFSLNRTSYWSDKKVNETELKQTEAALIKVNKWDAFCTLWILKIKQKKNEFQGIFENFEFITIL